MTGFFRRDHGANQPPHGGADPRTYQTQCPSCGLLNDGSARFCRNCGLPLGWPQDPVRGTTTRRAELPSERGSGLASIVGLLAALALLAGAAYLVSEDQDLLVLGEYEGVRIVDAVTFLDLLKR